MLIGFAKGRQRGAASIKNPLSGRFIGRVSLCCAPKKLIDSLLLTLGRQTYRGCSYTCTTSHSYISATIILPDESESKLIMSRQRSSVQKALSDKTTPSKKFQRPTNRPGLLNFEQLPTWLQDNAYLRTGYRAPSSSVWRSLASSFGIHNETVNILSHFVGAVAFLILAQCPFPLALPTPPFPVLTLPLNDWPLFPFYGGAVVCLTLSALYHATSNVSPEFAKKGNQADYVGIIALIIGSFISSIYYGFQCHPYLQKTYWTMITSIGAACAVVTVNPRFRTPEWRAWRAAMFVAMGMSAVIPVIHGLRIYGLDGMEERIGLRWLAAQGLTYVAGATLYALRIPEKWYPGKFDILGASHQIFHIFVLIAAGLHLIGLLKAAEHKASELGRCKDIL